MSVNRRERLPKGIAPSTVEHFEQIPMAQSTLRDPAFLILPSSRQRVHSGRAHTLSGKTWNTPETIKEVLSFHRPGPGPGPLSPLDDVVRSEVRRLYTFGTDLNSHPDLLHGGVTATVLDSVLGTAVEWAGLKGEETAFTVQLNVRYVAAITTPGTVLVRAWCTKAEGRKYWAEGLVEGEGGVVHARAEGMWVTPRGKGEGKEVAKL